MLAESITWAWKIDIRVHLSISSRTYSTVVSGLYIPQGVIMGTMWNEVSLVNTYLLLITVQHANALDCFNCTRTEPTCKDDVFQDHDQPSVSCGVGSCIKIEYKDSDEIDRYCNNTRRDPGCLTTSDATICACDYKNNCNGPVGAPGAAEGGLQCYDCYLNPDCSDDMFGDHKQVLVNCGTGSCIKTKFSGSGQVHRHCSSIRLTEGCADQTYDGSKAVSCACNDKDGCNVAPTIRQTFLGYVLSLSLLFLIL